MTPQNRTEQYLNYWATGSGNLPANPETRLEMYLSYILTKTGTLPTPVTRTEQLLYQIATQEEPETDNYGKLVYDGLDELADADISGQGEVVSAEITDFDLLKEKLEEADFYRDSLNLMYENWDPEMAGWYCWDLGEDKIELEEYGIAIELEEGAEFADAQINLTWQETGITNLKITIQDEDMFDQLCSSVTMDGIFEVGDKKIQKKKVKKYTFGTLAPNEIGISFLANCWNVEIIGDLPSNVKKLGASFLYNCRSFNTHLTFDNITSVGSSFLCACVNFNQEVNLEKVTTFEQMFMMSCQKFNHPVRLVSSTISYIPSNFMRECYQFNSELVIGGTITSIGEYFLYGYGVTENLMMSFNQPIDDIIKNARTISNGFMSLNKAFNQNITLPSCLTSPPPTFFYCNPKMVSTITVNCNPSGFNNYMPTFLSTYNVNDDAYVQGVKIAGPYASAFMTRFPNRTSQPYRKFIAV